MNDDLVTLPAPPQKGRRAPFPWLAATVPMVGGVVLWAVTGSMVSLLFALLGPLIAVASIVDSVRAGRRTHRTALALYARQLARARERISAQHVRELSQLNATFPDVLRLIAAPPRLWRAMPGDEPPIVLARGERPSTCRVTVPDYAHLDDPSAEVLALQQQATTLHDAPITAGMRDGVMIRGEEPFARAAARALVLQLCMTHAPGAMTLAALPEHGWEWAEELPHRAEDSATGLQTGHVRLSDGFHPATSQPPVPLWVAEAGATDASAGYEPGIRIVYGSPTSPVDVRCGALIDLCGADGTAVLSIAEFGDTPVRAAMLGEVQARALTTVLRERATAMFPQRAAEAVAPPFAELLVAADGFSGGGPRRSATAAMLQPGGKLPAPFMFAEGEVLSLDIVEDGPHALVAGMTGSGKSELLVSWVTALSALYPPERVVFLLADFKGGTAFAPLAALPHVVGMITDLDDAGASRALESLRAEIRWRETCLAEAGARDIADGAAQMPRLIVVIDEFAALLAQHPALQELFADIAARGRALGIHLILGTQRAAGTVRDALLANIPLRVCLRVVDEADSRAVVGAPGAAALPVTQPGAALVRRPRDHTPGAARVVLAGPGDRDAAGDQWAGHPAPRRPWLPPLPTTLHAAELERKLVRAREGQPALVLGMLDEPAAQRQRAWAFELFDDRNLLVIGGPGTGRSTVLQMVAHAATTAPVLVECVQIGDDRERAWDTIEELASGRGAGVSGAHTIVLIDNLDTLLAGFPGDYAARCGAQIELLLREGMRWGISVVATVQRTPVAGTRLGELFNTRLVLGLQHRTDHLAAGEDANTFVAGRPPGRGIVRGSEVQVALPPRSYASDGGREQTPPWHPPAGLVSVVTRVPALLEAQLRIGWGAGVTVVLLRTLAPGTRAAELEALGHTVVVVGDADAWQQHWSLLAALRAGHPLIIDSGSWAEFRALTGSRELPPYIASDAAWLCTPDGTVGRVRLPRPRIHGAPFHGTARPAFGAAAPRAGGGAATAAPADPASTAWIKP